MIATARLAALTKALVVLIGAAYLVCSAVVPGSAARATTLEQLPITTYDQSPNNAQQSFVGDVVEAVVRLSDATPDARATAKPVSLSRYGTAARTAAVEEGMAGSVGEASGLTGNGFHLGVKIERQMGARGWSREAIADVINNPSRTAATRDTRWIRDGQRMNDPATAYLDRGGAYVVRNDVSGDIVQVSNRLDPNWKSPW